MGLPQCLHCYRLLPIEPATITSSRKNDQHNHNQDHQKNEQYQQDQYHKWNYYDELQNQHYEEYIVVNMIAPVLSALPAKALLFAYAAMNGQHGHSSVGLQWPTWPRKGCLEARRPGHRLD